MDWDLDLHDAQLASVQANHIPVQEEEPPMFNSPPFVPCELVLKGHWLEGEMEEEGPSYNHNQPLKKEPPTYLEQEQENINVTATEIHSSKIFKCASCSYTGDKLLKLRNHEKIHFGDVFRCSSCDFQTNMKRNLTRHELNHSDTKKYACDKCDYQNNSKVLFHKHILSHSETYKNSKFKCPRCSFATDEREVWKMHVVTHDKIKLHECYLCDYVTTKLSDIKRHNMTHSKNRRYDSQEPSEVKPARPTKLIGHNINTQKEKKFKCKLCAYATDIKSSLNRHLLIHEGTKALKCSVCDYRTHFRNRLRNHERIHLQIKEFKCTHCEFETKHKLSLSRHILKYHKKVT